MSKIEKLSKEQERHLADYREEWLAHGRSTTPADRITASQALIAMYEAIGETKPYVWWCDGPAVGSLARTVLRDNLRANLRANLWDNLRDNLWANLRDNLWANLWANLGANLRDNLRANLWANLWANLGANLGANLWANLRANLGDNLRANLRDNLGANLWANLGANLRDNLGANLGDNLRDNLGANLWANLGANLGANLRENLRANLGENLGDNLRANLRANLRDNLGANLSWPFWGQHESHWPAYYAWPDLALREMFSQADRERLSWWIDLAKSCGWWQPFRGIVFVCERPQIQAVNSRGQLHHESGPAILCRDGWPVYALNGVRMLEEHVMVGASELDPRFILKERNAEVRRELIRKIGVERFMAVCKSRTLDKVGDYELLSIALSDEIPDARYLKMVNPSIHTFHVEGVDPQCVTVEQALNWRNSDWFTHAEQLT